MMHVQGTEDMIRTDEHLVKLPTAAPGIEAVCGDLQDRERVYGNDELFFCRAGRSRG